MNVLQKIAHAILLIAGLAGCAIQPVVVPPETSKLTRGKQVYIDPAVVYHDTNDAKRILRKEEMTREIEEGGRMSMSALADEFRRAGFEIVGTECPDCASITVTVGIWYSHNKGIPLNRISGVALQLTVTQKNSRAVVTYPRAYLYHERGWILGWTEERIHKKAAAWAVNDMLGKWETVGPIQGIVK